ncbi:MAG: 50S ribosomal protein L7/L12 [Planctomycetota bacterium]
MTTTVERNWSADIKDLGDKIVNLSGLQAKELSDYIKDVHGIEPASGGAVMMAAPAAGGAGDDAAAEAGPSSYDVILKAAGQKKIQIIKTIRELTGKSLKEAKDMADGCPAVIKAGVDEAEANSLKEKLEADGGEVELKAK